MPKLTPKSATAPTQAASPTAAALVNLSRGENAAAVARWHDAMLPLLRGVTRDDASLLLAIGVRMSQYDRDNLLRILQAHLSPKKGK